MTSALEETAKQCAEMINRANRIVVLSGAGMSTAAGIPDFRGPNGVYASLKIDNPQKIFEIDTFRQDPSLFYTHGRAFLENIRNVAPTLSHRLFAALEKEGKMAGIITQNIDNLHQAAGATGVIEFHGNCETLVCLSCDQCFGGEEVEEGEARVYDNPNIS